MLFEKINDYAKAIVTETAKAVQIAQAMIVDAEIAARAEAHARHYTDCRNCQAGMVNFFIANPDAAENAAADYHRETWENCETCTAEYNEWTDNAAEAELARLGDGYLHAVNGDDHRWQNGGGK